MTDRYPRTANELVSYLQRYPRVQLVLSRSTSFQIFKGYDGISRISMLTEKGNISTWPTNGTIGGKVHYNSDGFTRTIGNIIANYYYTGPKPWQKEKPERVRQRELWDEIFENLGM